MEFKKFSAREIKSTYPIMAIKMQEVLCQDLLFDLNVNYCEADSFKFSTAFFYDFYKIRDRVSWDNVYVLDGVEFLHRSVNSNKPLVRDRALYKFLYKKQDTASAFVEAIVTNPWLNDLCIRPMRIMSDRVTVINSVVAQFAFNNIQKAIIQDLDSGFTPRGVWGLDYMFMWKTHHDEPVVHVNGEISLIRLDEYIKYFSQE